MTVVLPWVSRLAYEAEKMRGDEWKAVAEQALARLHTLTLQGAIETPAKRPVAPPPHVDPVVVAINAQAGGNRPLRARMLAQAHADRAAGIDDQEIIGRVQAGTTLDEFLSNAPDAFGAESVPAPADVMPA